MILITGGGGFIGVNCALRFVDTGQSVVLVDHERARAIVNADLKPGIVFEAADVMDGAALQRLAERHKVTGILHLAAPLGTTIASEDAMLMATTMLRNVLAAARAVGAKRVCTASSIAAYFGVDEAPYREDTRLALGSPVRISAVKKVDELVGEYVARTTGLSVISLRLASIYGPRYRSMYHLIARLCHTAHGRSVPPPPPHGAADTVLRSRDFCYVDDAVRGIEMIQSAPSLKHQVYNIGSNAGSSDDAIKAAAELAQKGGDVPPAKSDTPYYLDISRIKAELGFTPQYDLNRGVKAYFDWLRTHDY